MCSIAIVFACVTYAVYGQQVQVPIHSLQKSPSTEDENPMNVFTKPCILNEVNEYGVSGCSSNGEQSIDSDTPSMLQTKRMGDLSKKTDSLLNHEQQLAKDLRGRVKGCLKDHITDAGKNSQKLQQLEKVYIGEVFLLMKKQGIPLTALPDLLPWSHDELTADAAILAGADAAESIVQKEFEDALDSFMHVHKNGTHMSNVSGGTHGDVEKLLEQISVLLEMCGDSEEVEAMVDGISSLKGKENFSATDDDYVFGVANHVSNKCQLDTLDLSYFVGKVGPGNVRKGNSTCNSLIGSALLSMREKTQRHPLPLQVHSEDPVLEHSKPTDREAYCNAYFSFVSGSPDHWISRSSELQIYVNCFCVERRGKRICHEEHASELAIVHSQVEAIMPEISAALRADLGDLPDPSSLVQDFPESSLLDSDMNTSLSAPVLGPCFIPISCEFCLADYCISTDISKGVPGKEMRKMSSDFFGDFSSLLNGPSSCFSGSCTPCVAIQPGEPLKFQLTIGMSMDSCSSATDALASFKVYISPSICVGGALEYVLEKIGAGCKELGEIAWYPFIGKVEAFVDFGFPPLPIPLTRVRFPVKLVFGELTPAVFAACKLLHGHATKSNFNCVKNMFDARGHGDSGIKVETGITLTLGCCGYYYTIDEWKVWVEENWRFGQVDSVERALHYSGYPGMTNGILKIRDGICVDAYQRNQNGGQIGLWYCDKDNHNQQWKWEGDHIKNKHGKCLDAPHRNTDGALTHMWDCVDHKNQQWQTYGSKGLIKNKDGGCLSADPRNAVGVHVMIKNCNDGDLSQIWDWYH